MSLSLCGSIGANTGDVLCAKSKGVLKKIGIFNGTIGSASYADEATFHAKLVANAKLAKASTDKLFVLSSAEDIADNSESNATGSLNQGFTVVLREGRPVYTVKMFGSAALLKQLRKFNNKTVRVIEYDANGVWWGTKTGTNFLGYKAKLFFSGGKMATGQNVEEGVITFTISILDVNEYVDQSVYMDCSNSDIDDIVGLIDAQLAYVSNSTNVFKIKMIIDTGDLSGGKNIYDDFGAAIAALAASFSAGTGTDYATSLAITSIAVDATLKALTVTFDSTAFTALDDGTKIKLTPPTPTQLDTGSVPEIELLPVILTK